MRGHRGQIVFELVSRVFWKDSGLKTKPLPQRRPSKGRLLPFGRGQKIAPLLILATFKFVQADDLYAVKDPTCSAVPDWFNIGGWYDQTTGQFDVIPTASDTVFFRTGSGGGSKVITAGDAVAYHLIFPGGDLGITGGSWTVSVIESDPSISQTGGTQN